MDMSGETVIDPQAVIKAIITLDYDTVRTAIAEGFDFNQTIPGKRPLVEVAQPTQDITMLRLLWEAGATPTTPWLEKVFGAFEHNEENLFLQREEPLDDPATLQDLTLNFSATSLVFMQGKLILRGKESAIVIPVKPFLLDGEKVRTAVVLEPIILPSTIEAIEKRQFRFPVNPEAGYIDGSIYLQNAHHPVDVPSITFGNLSPDQKTIEATLVLTFLFTAIGLPKETITRTLEMVIHRSDMTLA
jgi:hypothetical protein